MGGLAARLAGARFLGIDIDRASHAERAQGGARRPQGAADEGRPAARDDPRGAAQGVRRRARPAAVAGAADGPAVRAPPHGGRARAGLAREVRRLRARRRGRRLARPGPSRDRAGRPQARLQAAVPEHRERGRGRPHPARAWSSASIGATTARSTPSGSTTSSPSACARSSTTGARPSTSRSIATMLSDEPAVHVPEVAARALERPPADHDLARRPPAARADRPAAGAAQPARLQHVPRLVRAVLRLRGDPRRPAPRQLLRARRT